MSRGERRLGLELSGGRPASGWPRERLVATGWSWWCWSAGGAGSSCSSSRRRSGRCFLGQTQMYLITVRIPNNLHMQHEHVRSPNQAPCKACTRLSCLFLQCLLLAWRGDAVALCGTLLRAPLAQTAAGRGGLAHIRARGSRRGQEKGCAARKALGKMLRKDA